MARKRPQLKVKDLKLILKKFDQNAPIFLASSIVNLDEPQRTQEFIDSDRKVKCVAIEYYPGNLKLGMTLGWAEE